MPVAPPTKAKESAWQEQERFVRERQAFIEATDALVVAQRKNKDDASHA